MRYEGKTLSVLIFVCGTTLVREWGRLGAEVQASREKGTVVTRIV